MRIALDMDGPLVNFSEGVFRAHGLEPSLANKLTRWRLPGQCGLPDDEEAFWKPIFAKGALFWETLMPTPYATRLVDLAGIDGFVITSPISGVSPDRATDLRHTADCVIGKLLWLDTWFPHLRERAIFACDKGLVANSYTVLVDDKPENVAAWNANGGRSVLWPCPHNNSDCGTPAVEAVIRKISALKRL